VVPLRNLFSGTRTYFFIRGSRAEYGRQHHALTRTVLAPGSGFAFFEQALSMMNDFFCPGRFFDSEG